MHFAKQLSMPPAKRDKWMKWGEVRSALDDIHCFEATQVIPLVAELGKIAQDMDEEQNDQMYALGSFLPAPKTWIEFKFGQLQRIGVLCEQEDDDCARVTAFWKISAWDIGLISTSSSTYRVFPYKDVPVPNDWAAALGDETGWRILSLVHTILVIINSPRLIGREQHMPHRGLERRLERAKELVGSFPLRAWTELKLSVADIGRNADGTMHEAHYTGEKCLHFCRSHLRIRRGRLERVTAHWRGNPALGIKRTRYAVTQ
jgi:hypothetical protein